MATPAATAAAPNDNQSIPFFCIKSIIGFFYYQWLVSANLASPKSRFITFQLFSPLIKLHHLHTTNRYTHKAFLFSLGHDLITSTLYYFIVIHLKGVWYSLGALPLLFPPMAILELVFGYNVLKLTEEPYVVKPLSWVDPAAFFGLGMIMFTLLGLTAEGVGDGERIIIDNDNTQPQATMPLHQDFVAFICLLLWTDLQFGVSHYISHRIPRLWTKHKIHHEYGRGTLNGWSNLHGEALDNIQMNGVLLLPILLFAGYGQLHPSLRPFTDWLYLIPFTHLRFQSLLCNLMTFFEWDLVDMLLQTNRLGSYHSIHHETVSRNFSIFGIWPDSVCKSVGLFLIGDDCGGGGNKRLPKKSNQ
ncbi:hypothetical protein ACHAXM_004301 [Skeletonema potamos]